MKRKIVVVISLRSFAVGSVTRHFYALAIDPEILGDFIRILQSDAYRKTISFTSIS